MGALLLKSLAKYGVTFLAVTALFASLGCAEKEEKSPNDLEPVDQVVEQETPAYELSGVFKPQTGMVIVEERRQTLSEGVLKIDFGGMASEGSLKGEEQETRRLNYRGPTRVDVEITNSEKTEERILSGRTDTHRDQNPLEGIPLVGRKEGGRWTYQLGAGSPSPVVASALGRMTSAPGNVDLFEGIEGEVGDSWDLDPWRFSVLLERDWSKVKGEVKATFKEVVQREGHQCAVIELTFDIEGESLERAGKLQMHIKGEGTLVRALELDLNLSLTIKGDFEKRGQVMQGQETEMIEVKAKLEQEISRQVVEE